MKKHVSCAVTGVFLLMASAALAQSPRTFVSGAGADKGACTLTAPCRTLQFAQSETTAGGEIVALNSVNFGQITITKSLIITSPAGIEGIIIASAGGNAITVNTSDPVTIQGFTLDGGGSGANGIYRPQLSGASLNKVEIENCTIRRFSHAGIYLYAAPFFAIDKTTLLDNGTGVILQGGPIGTISDSTIFGSELSTSSAGIAILNSFPNNIVNVINDTLTKNYNGIFNGGGQLNVTRSSLSDNNADIVNGNASLFISYTSAQTGIQNNSGGYVYTYGNNSIAAPIPGNVTTIQQR